MKQHESAARPESPKPLASQRPALKYARLSTRVLTRGALVASLALAGLLYIGLPAHTNAATGNQAVQSSVASSQSITPHLVDTAFAMPAPPAKDSDSATLIKKGSQLFQAHTCSACHGPKAEGTAIAPPLAGIGHYFNEETFSTLIHHPNAQMTAKGMPPAPLSDQQTHALWTYLNSMPVPEHLAPGVPAVVIFKDTAASAPRSTTPPHAIATARSNHRTAAAAV
ncbi:MAG: c-type cytochrome [Acidobacteriaceae bacterium]